MRANWVVSLASAMCSLASCACDLGGRENVEPRTRGPPAPYLNVLTHTVMLSVVLGRATRACVIHITGITCEGVAVSSDVFDSPARRRGGSFYLRDVAD